MARYRLFTLFGAIVFLVLAAANLWRILVGFPITIGETMVGNAISYFAFAAFTALGVMMIREARTHD